jgi:hypothetical protein
VVAGFFSGTPYSAPKVLFTSAEDATGGRRPHKSAIGPEHPESAADGSIGADLPQRFNTTA